MCFWGFRAVLNLCFKSKLCFENLHCTLSDLVKTYLALDNFWKEHGKLSLLVLMVVIFWDIWVQMIKRVGLFYDLMVLLRFLGLCLFFDLLKSSILKLEYYWSKSCDISFMLGTVWGGYGKWSSIILMVFSVWY